MVSGILIPISSVPVQIATISHSFIPYSILPTQLSYPNVPIPHFPGSNFKPCEQSNLNPKVKPTVTSKSAAYLSTPDHLHPAPLFLPTPTQNPRLHPHSSKRPPPNPSPSLPSGSIPRKGLPPTRRILQQSTLQPVAAVASLAGLTRPHD